VPLVPVAPPVAVPISSGFDYVTVDAERRRVYAAHTGSRALVIFDAETGAVEGQVRVGPMHGVAVDPETGNVFTGNGESNTVSEVDPSTMKVLRSTAVPGPVDAIAYDAVRKRIYADEDGGTRVFVIDASSMHQIATVTLPGEDPEYLVVDPATHDVYQNINDVNEFVVIDPSTLKVKKVVPTPGITKNHPLQYDAVYHEIVVGGSGVLAAYDRSGQELGHTSIPRVDQCSLDSSSHLIACAGGGFITVLRTRPNAGPEQVAQVAVARGVHTTAIDPKTGNVWAVWAAPEGDFVQRFALRL
jgi:hypothetical protein